jgi:hypothetical protein
MVVRNPDPPHWHDDRPWPCSSTRIYGRSSSEIPYIYRDATSLQAGRYREHGNELNSAMARQVVGRGGYLVVTGGVQDYLPSRSMAIARSGLHM